MNGRKNSSFLIMPEHFFTWNIVTLLENSITLLSIICEKYVKLYNNLKKLLSMRE